MKKIYIYIFSIFLLFITNVNAVEDFEVGEAYLVTFEVPENEQWMVDRLSQQYPELEITDTYRIQTSFGTYYGAVNNRALPHGPGILSVSKDGIPTGTALEAEFKKGKLNNTDEFTLLGINTSGEPFEFSEGFQVEAKNRAFNNGFDLIADVNTLIKESASRAVNWGRHFYQTTGCMGRCRELLNRLENIINQDYSGNRNQLFIELEDFLFDIMREKNVLQNIEDANNMRDVGSISDDAINVFGIWIMVNESNFLNEFATWETYKDTIDFYEQMSESIFMILGGSGIQWLEGYALIRSQQTASDLNNFMTKIDSYQQSGESVLFNIGDPLYFTNLVFNNYMDWQNTVTNNTTMKRSANLQFSEFRYVNNFNFRKNKNEDVIQGKLDGKWYDLELNPDSLTYDMTASARRDFENNSGDRGTDGGDSSGGW